MVESPEHAVLVRVRAPRRPTGVVLVLHGGAEESSRRVTAWMPAVLRLIPVARSISRRVRGAAVYRLRFSHYGWNDTGSYSLADARWALGVLRGRYPGRPLVLVGHSLGARVSLRLGGDPGVAGLVALTPWAPDTDPVEQLADRTVMVGQGSADTVCPEPHNRLLFDRAEAAGAHIRRTLFTGLGHGMIKKFWVWHAFAARGVRQILTCR